MAMRLDKYLKVSRIIKRRTVAKAGTVVKEGDIIEIQFATQVLTAKIVNIVNHVTKENAKNMYEIISGEEDKE